MLSVGGFRSVSVFLPALLSFSLLPLVISPLALLPFLRFSCDCLFCPSSYGVFSYSSPSFGGFGLLHSHACSSTSACSCLCSLWVHCISAFPSSGVSVGWGVVYVGFCTGITSGSSWCFFSFSCLDSSICASSYSFFFLSSCFPASGGLGVLSSCLFSLAFDFLGVACLFCSWLGLSSTGFCGFLFTCGVSTWRSDVFSYLCSSSFCSAPLDPTAGLLGLPPLSGTSAAPCFPAVTLPDAPVFSEVSTLSPLHCSSWLRCGSLWLWLCFG